METIKELLVEELQYYHDIVLDDGEEPEARNQAHKKLTEVTDRLIKLGQMEAESLEAETKLKLEENKIKLDETKFENSKEDTKKSNVIRWVEVVAVPVGILVLDFAFKRSFATRVCNFEKDYTFTTTAGRSISGLFKFKR